MTENSKIKRITIWYENESKSLYGDEAQTWLNLIGNMAVFCQNHNCNPYNGIEFNWEIESLSSDINGDDI